MTVHFHECLIVCPNCGKENTDRDEPFEDEWELEEGLSQFCKATCPDCKKDFMVRREVEIEYTSGTMEEYKEGIAT
jgi:predicted RNA-binding Zn-ribbon protein involved in translation (DUF1610 family)